MESLKIIKDILKTDRSLVKLGAPLLLSANFILNCLICVCTTLMIGAMGLCMSFLLLAMFFHDRILNLFGPKMAVQNFLKKILEK